MAVRIQGSLAPAPAPFSFCLAAKPRLARSPYRDRRGLAEPLPSAILAVLSRQAGHRRTAMTTMPWYLLPAIGAPTRKSTFTWVGRRIRAEVPLLRLRLSRSEER